jgi:internalin A
LQTHLKLLQLRGIVETWNDRRVAPGDEWKNLVDDNIERADIILLLLSADFLASYYSLDKEVGRALERDAAGEARVVPVILRPLDWHAAPFTMMQALPREGRAVTQWENRDAAWQDVAEGIMKVAEELRMKAK